MSNILKTIVRYLKNTDLALILIACVAMTFGVVLIYSAAGTGRTIMVQIIGAVIGLICMVILSQIDYHDIAKLWKPIAIGCILLFILTLIIGKSRAGSQDKSWIWIGPITVQPAEYIKVAFTVTLAMHIEKVKDRLNSPLTILLLAVHGLIPIAFLIVQRDIGMTLIYFLMFAFMLFAANVRLRYFSFAAIVLLIGSPLIWNKILKGTQKDRIYALIDPANYAKQAYQQLQGIKALGSGEMYGYGLFRGPITQGAASLLPEKQNDMIFCVVGEELGFIGCIAVICLVLLILFRIIRDSRKAKDSLGEIICMGIFAAFAAQMFINIGAAMMIFPITGVALPFFSSGPSSLVSSFLSLGLVLSVCNHGDNSLFMGKE